jgi:beta-N-acetylhexosaminidase
LKVRSQTFILLITLFANIFLQAYSIQLEVNPQVNDPERKATELLSQMTPAEKVGQLFLISFQGKEFTKDSPVYDMIVNHHVGGVILNQRNDNFTSENTIVNAQSLINNLQQSEWNDSQSQFTDLSSRLIINNNYIPLLATISQDGDSFPFDQILNGVTILPNEMAIGATWDTNYSQMVGNVFGSELSSLGFNLYIGPSLDVLDLPYVEGGDDLGTRTFGGDPYWVGEMGKAFIKGIHQGSESKMAVIAKHFPGRGSSDRLPEEEVATVRKSLEQLKQIELAPFFSVTGNAPDKISTADGLLVSHIRYQGFQGNIRATTRPVSFDQAAQEQLMSLPTFAEWRGDGGIIVSDNLGSNAVRKFFDPAGEEYDLRQIARNAFLSGNDLMLLDLFVDARDLDPYATTLRILESFTQKYQEDAAFAQRVDSSVKRILMLKFNLYPEFSIDQVLVSPDKLSDVGNNQQVSFEVASQSAVLMSPDLQELSVIMPSPPQISERMIFFTDSISASQCSGCNPQDILEVSALEKSIIKFYGPESGEQVMQARLASFSFTDLTRYLSDPATIPTLDSELRNANWIIFAFNKPDLDRPESFAMQNFLTNRADLIRNKKIVAFGFNAPYYLDATDISKLTAYYVLFSKGPAFIDTAARILFQETNAEGTLPVSVPGIGYDLIVSMSPDPIQVIPVFIEYSDSVQPTNESGTPSPKDVPVYELGKVVPVRTGIIYDHNRNPVPDGTVVKFVFSYQKDINSTQQIETTTLNGIARLTFRVQNTGTLEISAESDPALNSQVLTIEVPAPEGAEATIVVLNTPYVTETPTPNPTSTTLPVTEVPIIDANNPDVIPGIVDWFAMVIILSITSGSLYMLTKKIIPIRWIVRWILLAVIGGIIAYIITVFQISVKASWTLLLHSIDLMMITLSGLIIGWFAGWLWYIFQKQNLKKRLFTHR